MVAIRCPAGLALVGCIACGSVEGGAAEDPGEGTVSGKVLGHGFTAVGSTYRIGAPDDPDRTIVVYVFDREVACGDIGSPAWDERIGDGVQSLEMKMIGLSPGDYAVAGGPTLGTGDASVNYTVTSTASTPQEISAEMGTVTLLSVADDLADGTFDLTFPDGDAVQGDFQAAPCPEGHEP